MKNKIFVYNIQMPKSKGSKNNLKIGTNNMCCIVVVVVFLLVGLYFFLKKNNMKD